MTSRRTGATPDRSLLDWVARISTGLARHGVAHALVGGIAVAAHGFVRATTDIDVVVPSLDSIDALRMALGKLGLLNTTKAPTKFRRIQILRALIPQGDDAELVVLDVLFAPAALASSILKRAVIAEIGGDSVPIAGIDDLILLKLLRDSAQDRVDIERLAALAKLDRRYLRSRAKQLGIERRLARALPGRRSKRS